MGGIKISERRQKLELQSWNFFLRCAHSSEAKLRRAWGCIKKTPLPLSPLYLSKAKYIWKRKGWPCLCQKGANGIYLYKRGNILLYFGQKPWHLTYYFHLSPVRLNCHVVDQNVTHQLYPQIFDRWLSFVEYQAAVVHITANKWACHACANYQTLGFWKY